MIVALQSIDSDNLGIIVSNCHLYWEPNYEYERIRQTCILIEKILKLNEKYNYSIILSGGFFFF